MLFGAAEDATWRLGHGRGAWLAGRALRDGVPGCWVAAAKVPSAYTRMMAHSVSSGAQSASARTLRTFRARRIASHTTRAFLIATELFEVELTSSQQTRKFFRIATFSAVLSGAIGDAAPRALPAGLYARVLRGENLDGYHDCWDQEEDGYRDPHQGGGALLVFER